MDAKDANISVKRKRTVPLYIFVSWMAVCLIAGFGLGIFVALAEMDRNLVYMGLYFDDVAVKLVERNASEDAIFLASKVSSQFCLFFQAQTKVMGENLASGRYLPVCNFTRIKYDGNGFQLQEIGSEKAAALAEELRSNPPYFALVFNNRTKYYSRELDAEFESIMPMG